MPSDWANASCNSLLRWWFCRERISWGRFRCNQRIVLVGAAVWPLPRFHVADAASVPGVQPVRHGLYTHHFMPALRKRYRPGTAGAVSRSGGRGSWKRQTSLSPCHLVTPSPAHPLPQATCRPRTIPFPLFSFPCCLPSPAASPLSPMPPGPLSVTTRPVCSSSSNWANGYRRNQHST